MKVVISRRIGGFGLSEAAYKELGLEWDGYGDKYSGHSATRAAPELVAVVEKLGKAASGEYAKLIVIEVPDDVQWHIEENDEGFEWVAENHRTWTEDGMSISS